MTEDLDKKTRKATLQFLLTQGESTAAEIASDLGISVQAMRRHLRSLKGEGLAQPNSISSGPGRPTNFWNLTDKGHQSFNNDSATEKLALELLESMSLSLSDEQMKNLLGDQIKEKANAYKNKIGSGNIQLRLKRFVEIRSQEGYMGEYFQAKETLEKWYLNSFHCSIWNIAQKHPFLCDHELDLIRDIFSDCNVDRVLWRVEKGHSCAFEIIPKKS